MNTVPQIRNYRGTTDPASKRTCHAKHFVYPVVLPCSHDLLNRQTLDHVNGSRHLEVAGQAWIIVFPIVSQLSALPTVCQHTRQKREMFFLLTGVPLFLLRLNSKVSRNLYHTGNRRDLFWGQVISLSDWLCLSHSAINNHSLPGNSLSRKLFLKKAHLNFKLTYRYFVKYTDKSPFLASS